MFAFIVRFINFYVLATSGAKSPKPSPRSFNCSTILLLHVSHPNSPAQAKFPNSIPEFGAKIRNASQFIIFKLGFNPEPLLLRLTLFLNNVQFLRPARGNQNPNFLWLKVPRLLNPLTLPRTVQWRPYFNSSPSWNFSDFSIFNCCRYLRRR